MTRAKLRMIPTRVPTADPRRVKPPPRPHHALYQSREWRRLVDQVIQERGRVCEDPACATPRGPWSRIIGDHVQELVDGGAPLDKRNVLLRCAACHGRKTVQARKARAFDQIT